MKKLFSLSIMISVNSFIYSQGNSFLKFSSLAIPDSLKKNANAVMRLDEAVVEISSPSRYTYKVYQIVTVLNKEGAHHLQHRLGTDKFYKVDNIEIKLYNDFGIEVKKFKKKDFEITAAYDGISLVTDDKVLHLSTPPPGYPCTVETMYEVDASSYIELPDWHLSNTDESTELFRLIVKTPKELDIRHRSVNMNLQPQVVDNGKQKIYTWEYRNAIAQKKEKGGYAGGNSEYVQLAPTVFEYDGFKGEFKTWNDFGRWAYQLYEEKTPFTEERLQQINSLVNEVNDEREKIRILYNYLKKNMRYVSIQLGIGGFKPFAVKFVDEKKYGDCKALTNYMRYLLQAVGIKAYPALINASYNGVPADLSFPASTFNHVILCVPLKNDSVWLECTSRNNETGVLGSFTENKNALLLTENGGILVPTPNSNSQQNKLFSKTKILLNEEGGAETKTEIFCTGNMKDVYDYFNQLTADQQKTYFIDHLDYKSMEEFSFKRVNDKEGENRYELNLYYDKLFDFNAGSKMFFQQHINRLCDEDLKPSENRKTDYIFKNPYYKRDTTIFILPATFTTEVLPAKKEINTEYLSYKNEVIASGKEIHVISDLQLKKNIIPATEYNKIATAFESVTKDESQKIIIKKNAATGPQPPPHKAGF